MDTRVIINRPRVQDLSFIPELNGYSGAKADLTRLGSVMHPGEVSVILPTFFNFELKRASLELVLAGLQASACIAEVILVCSDGEQRSFPELSYLLGKVPLRLVEAPPHQRGGSRNVGAATASKPWLLFLDDDMILKGWRLVDVILSEVIAGGFDCALFPPRQYARFPLLYDRFCLEDTLHLWRTGGESPFLLDPLKEGMADLPMLFCFPGCFMLIHQEAYRNIGGFSEEFVGWGFEDTQFAVKAIHSLRVLNLFRKSEPLLHVDHPVSPYKSEEHQENWKKYYSSSKAVDVHRLCRTVFKGENFNGRGGELLGREIYVRPLEMLRHKGIPLQISEAERWICGVAEALIERFSSPVPEFGILHGSRANDQGSSASDFDVLLLYGGAVQEFFVSRSKPRVEVECTSLQTFSNLAERPWLYDHRGVLEIAKIAQARLLFGENRRWEHWKSGVLQSAAKEGLCFWLVLGIGLRLAQGKHGGFVDRYFRSLDTIAVAAGFSAPIESKSTEALESYTRAALDDQFPNWRSDLTANLKIFPLQVPEVWAGLYKLAERGGAL